jgi:hypothetical protein
LHLIRHLKRGFLQESIGAISEGEIHATKGFLQAHRGGSSRDSGAGSRTSQ